MDDRIEYVLANTQVLRPPQQKLATFGSTNVHYYMITELMSEVNVVREGRVIAGRPKIVTPVYLFNVEGFSGPAKRYIEMMAEKHPHEPGIFYTYKNETGEMNIVSQPLPELVDKINERIDGRNDPLSAVIRGVEEMWDVSLLKFTFELTTNSVRHNVSEMYGRGLFESGRDGVPQHARQYIEELFDKARYDSSLSAELISELKRWNLWPEYQDRFLQLFRKI